MIDSSEDVSGEASSDSQPKASRAMKKPKNDAKTMKSGFSTHAAITDLGLDRLDMTIDESAKNTSHFMNLVLNQGFRAGEDAMSGDLYTCSDVEAMHVYNMPAYDPEDCFYELVEDSVALVNHEQQGKTGGHHIVYTLGYEICMRSKDEDVKSEESKKENDKSIDTDTATSDNRRIGDT